MNDLIQFSRFLVYKEPYCVWEWDLKKRNLEFLEGIDPTYFEYIANRNHDDLEGENKQKAALVIRLTYSQALETLFAFLCATIQAPDCIIGWLQRYKPKQVSDMVKAITNNNFKIKSKLKIDNVRWENVSIIINQFKLEDKDRELKIKTSFGNLWKKFAFDFLDKKYKTEYNHLKHGLRVNLGGFTASIGRQSNHGESAPCDKMTPLGGSFFGSKLFIPEVIGKDRGKKNTMHFRVRRNLINWNPTSLIYGLELISTSIENIISFLKIMNGVDCKTVQFSWPKDEAMFNYPWENIPSVTSIGIDREIHEFDIKRFSKEEIKKLYF